MKKGGGNPQGGGGRAGVDHLPVRSLELCPPVPTDAAAPVQRCQLQPAGLQRLIPLFPVPGGLPQPWAVPALRGVCL